MTISEPITTGRFFAYPTDATEGAILPYWIAAGGTYARMSAGSRRAFCAVLEAVLERAVIPTLTRLNFSGSASNLANVAPGGGIMGLFTPQPELAQPGQRADIAESFARGADVAYWESIIKSAFGCVGATNPLQLVYDHINTIQLHPFALGGITGGSDGFGWSSLISIGAPAELCECVWHDLDREENPLYTGEKQFAPNAMRAMLDDILRGIGSVGHRIAVPDESACDLGAELQQHAALAERYNADTVRNWWEPPRASAIVGGPSWLTSRRSNVAYGVSQMLLGMAAWTMCRFRYLLDFVRTTKTRTTTYVLAMDRGTLRAIRMGQPVETETETHASSIYFARSRSLGGVVARIPMKIQHENSVYSPLAKTEAELVAINPRFAEGGHEATTTIGEAASSVLQPAGEGQSGELICDLAETNTTVGGDPACMDVWPHPALGEYVHYLGVVLCDRVDDQISMPDKDGRTPQGTVHSVRNIPANTVAETVAAHASWLLANCGITSVEMPEEVTPDDSYLARYGNERGGMISVGYYKGVNEVHGEGGVVKYLPVLAYFAGPELGFTTFSLDGDVWEASDDLVYAPDPDLIWRDEHGVEDTFSHSYGDGVAQVRWAWRAMPTED